MNNLNDLFYTLEEKEAFEAGVLTGRYETGTFDTKTTVTGDKIEVNGKQLDFEIAVKLYFSLEQSLLQVEIEDNLKREIRN